MRNKIFFDLDGTLLDCRIRLYSLFQELSSNSNLSFDQYWQIKRSGINQEKLLTKWLGYSLQDSSKFKKTWLEKVEDEKRLDLDAPYQFSGELLEKLHNSYDLYIVTNRQSESKAVRQINKFNWNKYLKDILVTKQIINKTELIEQNVQYSEDDIIITDTGEDIISGKKLGIKTIAIAHGFLSTDILQGYNPDVIFANLKEIYESNTL